VQFRFGPFRLDTDPRELFRDDRELHVTPKALDLLALLVANRPKALSKSELHERLWPDTYVTEANLANLIAEIRGALGDSATRPRYVRTVHRFGYAFVGAADAASARPRSAATSVCWLVSKTNRFPLDEGEHLVGRLPDAAVSLTSPTVSRHHARLVVTRQGATVEDLSSKNGTWVRGKQIKSPTTLKDGDQVKFGSVTVKFRRWSVGGTTRSSTPKMGS